MPNFDIQNLIAQLFGAVGLVALVLMYQQKDRNRLLAYKLTADLLWGIHYVLLGAYAGAIPNVIGIFREIVFVKRENKKWANNIIWPILFIIFGWVLAIFTWKSALTLLPMCASTFVTVSLWNKKPKITRIILIPVCTCFLIYDVFVGSWVGIVNESISIISIIISIFRNDIKKNKD